MSKWKIPEDPKLFGIIVLNEDGTDYLESVRIDASEKTEEVIGNAMGYYHNKYPGHHIVASEAAGLVSPDIDLQEALDPRYGNSYYYDGVGVEHNGVLQFKSNMLNTTTLYMNIMLFEKMSSEQRERYKVHDIDSVLCEPPVEKGDAYIFKNDPVTLDTSIKTFECFDPVNAESARDYDKMMSDFSYEVRDMGLFAYHMSKTKDRYGVDYDVLRYMPDEFRPHLLSCVYNSASKDYDLSIQIGKDIINTEARPKQMSRVTESVGSVVQETWKQYVADHILSTRQYEREYIKNNEKQSKDDENFMPKRRLPWECESLDNDDSVFEPEII